MLNALIRRAATLARDKARGAHKQKRIAIAKRKHELELRAAGFTRKQAKIAVSIRFGAEKGD